MIMFVYLKDFLYRHRRKLIASGILVGGTVLAFKYAQKKLMEWQEKEGREFLNRSRKQQHFKSTENTCNQTIHSLASTLKVEILEIVNTEELLNKLRIKDVDKISVWEDLKVETFTQHLTFLYSGLMLVIALRVQLNILGGYISVSSESNSSMDSEVQEIYLSQCQHFIGAGVKEMSTLIKRHVKFILKDVSLKKTMSLKDIENVFWSIQTSIRNDPENPLKNLSKYLIPPQNSPKSKVSYSELLGKMIAETIDVLQSNEINWLAESSLSRGYSNSVDRIAEYFSPKTSTENSTSESSNSTFTNVSTVMIPMAKIIPIIHTLDKDVESNGVCEPWVQQYILMDKIQCFGANIYEAFSFSSNHSNKA